MEYSVDQQLLYSAEQLEAKLTELIEKIISLESNIIKQSKENEDLRQFMSDHMNEIDILINANQEHQKYMQNYLKNNSNIKEKNSNES